MSLIPAPELTEKDHKKQNYTQDSRNILHLWLNLICNLLSQKTQIYSKPDPISSGACFMDLLVTQ